MSTSISVFEDQAYLKMVTLYFFNKISAPIGAFGRETFVAFYVDYDRPIVSGNIRKV